jgi:hypothetical protein
MHERERMSLTAKKVCDCCGQSNVEVESCYPYCLVLLAGQKEIPC